MDIHSPFFYLLVYGLRLLTLLGLVFTIVKWKDIELRKTWLTIFIASGAGSFALFVFVVKHTMKEGMAEMSQSTENLSHSIDNYLESTKPPERKINTYYINRLKNLAPDSLSKNIDEQFYTYFGRQGAWRLPLVYPYDIRCADKAGTCWLNYEAPDNVSSQVVPSIVKFNYDKTLLIAKVVDNKNDTAFAIYTFWPGKQYMYNTFKDMVGNAGRLGYKGDVKQMTIKEYEALFW